MQLPNLELSVFDPDSDQFELRKSIESILEIMMALNEEIVKKWIKEKYPNGIGLYETVVLSHSQNEPSNQSIGQPTRQFEATFKDTFNCAVCMSTSDPISWCEVHERFECDDCHVNEQKIITTLKELQSNKQIEIVEGHPSISRLWIRIRNNELSQLIRRWR